MATATPEGHAIDPGRNCLEMIRFATPEASRRALGAVVADRSQQHSFTSRDDPQVWVTRTATLRTLDAAGVPYEWLTKDV